MKLTVTPSCGSAELLSDRVGAFGHFPRDDPREWMSVRISFFAVANPG
jgi:hypothetical protein